MEWKDLIYAIGIFGAFVLGFANLVYNYRINRRTTFINSVTSERVKWIGKLRENISSFAGLMHYWVASSLAGTKESNEVAKEIDKLRMLIKLQLNPEGEYDKKIIQSIDEIPNLASLPDKQKILDAEIRLISDTQVLLKQEWEKIKEEAQKGALS